jgi:putative Mg2+ transporter-C (MgtC) family protein
VTNDAQLEALLRLVLAGAAGVALGLDREIEHKPAGVRTYATVAIGAALFTVGAIQAFDNDTAAVSRVMANVVTGIGFLGAGTIIHQRDRVEGLTTAAGIWAVAGIGVAFGNGLYVLATGATVILFFLVTVLGRVMARLIPKARRTTNDDARR